MLVLVVFLAVANIKIFKKRQEFLAQISDLKNQAQELKNKNTDFEQGIASTDDPMYIERVAREELDLQKPGEKAVSFIMPPAEPQKTDGASQSSLQSWFASIWGWLTGTK